METTRAKALVVLSGGQDSTTCLALALSTSFKPDEVKAITFDYGQRHGREIMAAHDVARLAGIDQPEVIRIPAGVLQGTSPLTNPTEQLEQYETYDQMDAIIGNRIEKTFVPMRNALFLTIAANRAVVMGASSIFTGVCQADNANYPDCRDRFITAQQDAIHEALGDSSISIITPLMYLTKAESLRRLLSVCGPSRFAWLAFSHTAYDGQYPPLGKDHATVLRAQGFVDASLPDPLIIRAHSEGLCELPGTANYASEAMNAAMLRHIDEHKETLRAGGAA